MILAALAVIGIFIFKKLSYIMDPKSITSRVVGLQLTLNFTLLWLLYKFVDIGMIHDSKSMIRTVAAFGFIIVFATYFLLKRSYKSVDPIIHGVTWFSWNFLTQGARALEMDGILPHKLNVWLYEAFPNTLDNIHHVKIFFLYNGIIGFMLGIAFVGLFAKRSSHREVGMYWIGSMLNGYWGFIYSWMHGETEVLTGRFLTDWLLMIAPVVCLMTLLHRRPTQKTSPQNFVPIWNRPVDLMFFFYFLFACFTATVRGFAVNGANISISKDYKANVEPYLDDPNGAFQILMYEFVYVIYYAMAMYGLWNPGQALWMSDLSIVHAGAAGQAQFTYVCGGLNSHTPKNRQFVTTGVAGAKFWFVNLLLDVVPQLFMVWTYRNQAAYGQTHTTDLASPVEEKAGNKKDK